MSARALYDFQGNAELGELSFSAGDMITIVRQDIGEGWWEGECNGQSGLFPESYVEVVEETAHSEPSAHAAPDAGGADDWDDDDDWEGAGQGQAEEEASDEAPVQIRAQATAGSSVPGIQPRPSRPVSTMSTTAAAGKVDTLKRGLNRFSVFVQAGAEDFLSGRSKDITSDPNDFVHIVALDETRNIVGWQAISAPPEEIIVNHAGSRKKFAGMKQFEAYEIGSHKPAIERRFKHFDWLHERLTNKYSCLVIPPLPDKTFLSKHGEDFVEKRRFKLQQWLNRVMRHPVLRRDRLSLQHFINYSTESNWKEGKRRAEKDLFVGAQFFKLIHPDVPCPQSSEDQIKKFSVFSKELEKNVATFMSLLLSHGDRLCGSISKEFGRFGAGFVQLAECIANSAEIDGLDVNLSSSIKTIGIQFQIISEKWLNQPKTDLFPMYEKVKEYAGLIPQLAGCLETAKEADARLQQLDSAAESSKVKESDVDIVQSRRDVLHLLALSEMAHFTSERRTDFKQMMKVYLDDQIIFYQNIVKDMQAARAAFD